MSRELAAFRLPQAGSAWARAAFILFLTSRRRAWSYGWSTITLFLGWPLLFNLPLFLLFFSDGMRHVAPSSAALLVAAVPPLLEAGFYASLVRRRRSTLAVAAMLVAAWFLAHWADRALLGSDTWRYWTPFLDPAPFAWYLR